jgi:polyhydroxybutyrate depolymerase
MHILTGRLPLRALGAACGLAFVGACSSAGPSASSSGKSTAESGSIATSTGSGAGSGVAAAGSPSGPASGSSVGSGTVSSGDGISASGVTGSGGASSGSGAVASGAGTDGGGAMPAGEGGVSSSGGTTVGDAGHVMPSAGCGMAPNQVVMNYVEYKETVTLPAGTNALWANRDYYVWLPSGYDPNRAYTTVFLGPGCGGTGDQVVPVQMASTTNAILIGLDPDPPAEGRPCFNTESPTTPEIPYFDETLQEVEAKFCIDTSRVFIAGFSSGAWLADTLGCVRAGVIRGQGTAAGELQGGLTCSGQPIAAMMNHDMGDPSNSYQQDFSGARAAIAMRNGCTTTTMPYDPPFATGDKDLMGHPILCVEYQGCKPGYPLVWCPTTGYGHSDQTASGLSTYGWWEFWEMLP